jgi:serine/threonine-protein kinase
MLPEAAQTLGDSCTKTVDLPRGPASPDAAVDVSAVVARTLLPSEASDHDPISFAATVVPVTVGSAGAPGPSSGGLRPASSLGVQLPTGSMGAPGSLPAGSLSPASQLRSTVLPRVEMVGTEPRMVHAPQLRYQEERLLGEGGVGEVVRVRDNDIERTVALKRIKADVRSPATVLRFMEEIRTVGRLEHPNIVPIHDVGVDDQGQFFFVMKYVNGETLENIIEKLAAADPDYLRRFPFEKRVQIFMGILEAIHYAHAQGIIHRDIKPANIMVGPYGEVVVMDWGLAKRIRGEGEVPTLGPASTAAPATSDDRRALFKTRVGSLLGTPAYMSPEQARGQNDIDERSDVYSLSVLFYELLSLRHYLPTKTTLAAMLAAVTSESYVAMTGLPTLAQGPVPAELHWIIDRGLAKDPAGRYQSVAEMIAALSDRNEGNIKVQCPITMVKSGTRSWMRFVDAHPLLVMGGMTVAVLLMLTGLGLGGYHLVASISGRG